MLSQYINHPNKVSTANIATGATTERCCGAAVDRCSSTTFWFELKTTLLTIRNTSCAMLGSLSTAWARSFALIALQLPSAKLLMSCGGTQSLSMIWVTRQDMN
jgi:hypothetical protein